MELKDKLEILADVAKYDASCASSGAPRRGSSGKDGLGALDIDPKLGWALANRAHFPLDLNRADEGMIARVPGIGLRMAKRLTDLRRLRRIRWEDLSRLRCSLKKLAPFVITADYKPALGGASDLLRRNLADAPQQMHLWPELQAA
jgi:predicted DNA-binding helix-hairpin-helix protein